jgi:hypothetical protein
MPGKIARSDPRAGVRVTRGAGSSQHLASVLQEGRENGNINAGLGFIWRISVKLKKEKFGAFAHIIIGLSLSLTASASTVCTVTIHSCPLQPAAANQTFDDDDEFGSATSDSACLQRASDFYNWCGTSDPVSASFSQNGRVVDSTTFPSTPPAQNPNLVTLSAPESTYSGNTAFWAYQHDWGGFTGVKYSESLTVNPSTFPAGTVYRWSYPADNYQYLSYPEIVWGAEAGGPLTPPNGVNVPVMQVDAIHSFTGTVDISLNSDLQGHDVLWEGYLTSGPNNGVRLVEIGIMLHSPSRLVSFAAGFPQYSYNSGGFSATIAIMDIGVGHPLVGVFPTGGDKLSGTFDILAIIRFLKSIGLVKGNEYLGGWALGLEILTGSGSMTVNQLSYTWN